MRRAAGAVVAIIDRDAVAGAAQLLGGGKPRGPGADNADRLPELAARAQRRHPAALPSGVGQIFLDRADGDCSVAGLFDDAVALAQPILRADTAADLGHVVGRRGELIGLLDAPLGGRLQPIRDVVLERTMDLAIGHAALRAARGLLGRLLDGEGLIDLVEVVGARGRLALLRRSAA